MLIHLQRPAIGWSRHPLISWEKESDAGGGDPPATSPSSPSSDSKPPAEKAEKTFTQAQVESMIAERVSRERSSWEKKNKDLQTKAEQEKAEKEGDLQKQLELAQTDIQRLQPFEAQAAELQQRIEKLIKILDEFYTAELTSLSEDAQALLKALPGDPPIEDKVQWLTQNKARFAVVKPTGTTPPTPPSNQQEKKPDSKAPKAEAIAQTRKSLKRVF